MIVGDAGLILYLDAKLAKSLQKSPDDLFPNLGVTICYVSLGREEEARAKAAHVLRLHPDFSLDHLAETLPYNPLSSP
jgi:hypothetical protein